MTSSINKIESIFSINRGVIFNKQKIVTKNDSELLKKKANAMRVTKDFNLMTFEVHI